MVEFDDAPRSRRDRKPRYYDSDSDSVDDYPPPKPRDGRRQQRPRPERGDPSAMPPQRPRPERGDSSSMPPPLRRPSILVDPDESGSQRAKRRPRGPSAVRLRTSDDESDEEDRPKARSSRGPPKPSRHDAERNLSPEQKKFREKRNGYESEEGELHRKSAHVKRRPDDDDEVEGDKPSDPKPRQERPRRGPRDENDLPVRGKSRDPAEAAVLGAAGGAATAAVIGDARLQRRRTYKERGERGDRGDEAPPAPRGEDPRSSARPPRGKDEEREYRSDHRPRRPDRRRDDDDGYDDRDRDRDRDRRRRDDGTRRPDHGGGDGRRPRPRDYYSDHGDDRANRRNDPRNLRQRDPARDRYRDEDRYRDHDKHRSDDIVKTATNKNGEPIVAVATPGGGVRWQKQASTAFVTYALPVIKKEGGRYFKKEMQKFLARQAGGG